MALSTSTRLGIAGAVLVLGGAGIYFDIERSQALDDRDQLKMQVAELKVQATEEAMPELPVSVAFHHALLGHSMVADFRSHASTDMAVVVDVTDGTTHGHRRFEISVGPRGLGTHIGPLEHMTFEPGDTLAMTHDGYKPAFAQVP
jgi:hypothetical protein